MYRWIVLCIAAIPLVLTGLRQPSHRFTWWTEHSLEKIRPYDAVPGPDGAVLSANNVAIYFERYLDLPKPSSIEGKAGEWPDALIPRGDRYFGEKRNAFPFKLFGRHDQPIWIVKETCQRRLLIPCV